MKGCIDEIERERKYLLDAREYFALKKAFAEKSEVILQKNYYYDTKDFEFGKRGITCRIREKCGKFVATVKTHSGRGDGISYEHSCAVRDEYDGSFFDARTSLWGVLVTERIILFADRFVEVALDRNSYLVRSIMSLKSKLRRRERFGRKSWQARYMHFFAAILTVSGVTAVCRTSTTSANRKDSSEG